MTGWTRTALLSELACGYSGGAAGWESTQQTLILASYRDDGKMDGANSRRILRDENLLEAVEGREHPARDDIMGWTRLMVQNGLVKV